MTRAPGPQLLEMLSAFDSPVADLALGLRTMLLEQVPHAVEKIYPNHPAAVWFGLGPKMGDMFCYVALARQHVNLGFCQGTSLPDPNRVLEGKGKAMRHIKFRSESDLDRPYLRRYISAAIDQLQIR